MDDRYRLVCRLGQGGMAEVYAAATSGAGGFSRRVAIKRILPHLTQDPRVARMFSAEARLATFLQHQNIVQVLDVGRAAQGLFIVMELVDGWDLGVVVRAAEARGLALPPELAAYVAVQTLAGLSHAYARVHAGQRVVLAHRDVSPANILVSREGEVKVSDFGIAKVEAEIGLTDPGTFKGKMAYAAPETLRGEGATAASDQFSLAVTLYELVSHGHPFGDASKPAPYIEALSTRAPAPLPGVPAAFNAILMRMLQRAPEARFASAAEVSRAFSTYLLQGQTVATGQELTSFLSTLGLPPAPSELPEDAAARVAFSMGGASWLGDLRPEEAETWEGTGAALSSSGEVVGATPKPAPKPPAPVAAGPAEPLELAYDPRAGREETFISAPEVGEAVRPSRRLWPWLLLVLALGATGATALAWPRLWRDVTASLPRPATAVVLTIQSEPAGARVRIGGQDVGQTPLFLDNAYPPGAVPIELTLKGYLPWSGSFTGGVQTTVEARLTHR